MEDKANSATHTAPYDSADRANCRTVLTEKGIDALNDAGGVEVPDHLYGCEREAAESTMAFIRLALGVALFVVPVALAVITEHFTGHNVVAIGIAAGVAQVVLYSVGTSKPK